ncbi:MAG: alpha-galactosidase [Candidatus Aminicenantes bacterium]|nr:MAG: alpha-galactosidase [Candidatus Aminicenantes bacterium]
MTFGRLHVSLILLTALLITMVSVNLADTVTRGKETINEKQVFWLSNNQVKCSVIFHQGNLEAECLETQPGWSALAGRRSHKIKTDADFGVDVQWTGWLAPGKIHNADNPVMLTKKHFQLTQLENPDNPDGKKELVFTFNGLDISLQIQLIYKLETGAFHVKRQLGVRDLKSKGHFLRWLWPRRCMIYGDVCILKPGGFGSPAALTTNYAGAFFGLEYPAAENSLKPICKRKTALDTGQEMGLKIENTWIKSEWSAAGLTPDTHVKLWFNRYLDSVRVSRLRPYLLYNTWYDVRSPEYTERPEDVMNETNLMRIINDFKREMQEKRGLKLDAFVLDDGWDIYKSDWVLREKEFPNGLTPIREALNSMGTDLGIWLGPIGGYSYRQWRVEWMKEHGFEVVGDQLCLAGTNYHNLFKKRAVDFVRNDGAAYFKWDGIQFSCSEPDHGHPVGIYSRRAVMESVKNLCSAVRKENPDIFLNITSGTWLSPWWMKYANMIWMQGRDYGYADVPSISKRDAAITYRDVILYENYGVNDSWFPLSNLMTHGIIKGHLQKLGGEAEPLDKFTDNAILYFSRGVTMWELYISPNLLTDGEWNAIARSIRWAKHRFETLKSTEMVGGDPGSKEAYGYVHFSKKRGIIAVRNPFIKPQTLKIELSPAFGLCPQASSLVLERVYPGRWVSPYLYAAGAALELPLQGYETAIYEIYPLEDSSEPLLAGVTFDIVKKSGKEYVLHARNPGPQIGLLNPGMVKTIKISGRGVPLHQLQSALNVKPLPAAVNTGSLVLKGSGAQVDFQVKEPSTTATLCFLVEPAVQVNEKKQKGTDTIVSVYMDGKRAEAEEEQQEGRWAWYKVNVAQGQHKARINIQSATKRIKWTGKISAWMVYIHKPESVEIEFDLVPEIPVQRPMPPLPRPVGEDKGIIKLGEVKTDDRY